MSIINNQTFNNRVSCHSSGLDNNKIGCINQGAKPSWMSYKKSCWAHRNVIVKAIQVKWSGENLISISPIQLSNHMSCVSKCWVSSHNYHAFILSRNNSVAKLPEPSCPRNGPIMEHLDSSAASRCDVYSVRGDEEISNCSKTRPRNVVI